MKGLSVPDGAGYDLEGPGLVSKTGHERKGKCKVAQVQAG